MYVLGKPGVQFDSLLECSKNEFQLGRHAVGANTTLKLPGRQLNSIKRFI